jgi:hypothetical protein
MYHLTSTVLKCDLDFNDCDDDADDADADFFEGVAEVVVAADLELS